MLNYKYIIFCFQPSLGQQSRFCWSWWPNIALAKLHPYLIPTPNFQTHVILSIRYILYSLSVSLSFFKIYIYSCNGSVYKSTCVSKGWFTVINPQRITELCSFSWIYTTLQPLFQFIVLVLWHTALMFRFPVTVLIKLPSSHRGQLFSALKNPLKPHRSLCRPEPNRRKTQLVFIWLT